MNASSSNPFDTMYPTLAASISRRRSSLSAIAPPRPPNTIHGRAEQTLISASGVAWPVDRKTAIPTANALVWLPIIDNAWVATSR